MAKYIYTRPVPCAFTAEGKDYHLHTGHEYELPEKNDFIRSLVGQGFLTAVEKTKASKTKIAK